MQPGYLAVEVVPVTRVSEQLKPWLLREIAEGFTWGCQCGESYKERAGAENCHKCRRYLEEPPTKVFHTPVPGYMKHESTWLAARPSIIDVKYGMFDWACTEDHWMAIHFQHEFAVASN